MTDFQKTINWLESIGYKQCTLGVASVMAYKEYVINGDDDIGLSVSLGQGEAGHDNRLTVTFFFNPDQSLQCHRIEK